jgi:hypothetical protein
MCGRMRLGIFEDGLGDGDGSSLMRICCATRSSAIEN